jgi:signal transduction histidine kinase
MARPDARPVAAILGDGPGGVMARAMLIPAVMVPLVLGYARVRGQQTNLFDTGLGTAIFSVLVVILFTALIWRTAITLDDSHRAREVVQRERDELLVREQTARETAERANRVKDEFLAALSHELRTPLNAIVGWTEMLRSDVVPPERRSHAADVVARNGQFLTRLIEDLLDVSRFATGQMRLTLQPVDLMGVTGRALDAIESSAKEKGVHLVADLAAANVKVAGDPERLQQILGNLLSNAVKFTPAGGRVEVIARVNGGDALVAVRDTGKGINPEVLPHVFDRFRQGDSTTTREHGGLGLGLSIARELAELHGGSVRAFSAGDGQGSTFTISIPILDRAAAATLSG